MPSKQFFVASQSSTSQKVLFLYVFPLKLLFSHPVFVVPSAQQLLGVGAAASPVATEMVARVTYI